MFVGLVCYRQYPSSGSVLVRRNIFFLLPRGVLKRRAAHFSENWGILSVFPVLGGNVFSIAFGRNLDAHAPPEEPSPNVLPTSSERQCLAGRECYVQTLYLNLWACVIVLGLAVWAGRRDWVDWQERGRRVKPAEWEDGEELVRSGSSDFDP